MIAMRASTSFRTKIFVCVLAVTLAALSLPVIYARVTLHSDLLADVQRQALREARLAGMLVEAEPDSIRLSSLLHDLGRLNLRLTLLDAQGRVLDDSDMRPEQLGSLDNHADRPEFREALARGEGVSTRHSNTLDNDLIYAAVRLDNGNVLRVAVPFAGLKTRIDSKVSAFSMVAGAAVLLSLLLALLLSYWLKHSLDDMVNMVEAISLGKYQRRLRSVPGSEFAALADAVNRMAENIEEHVRTVADQAGQLEAILDTMNDGVLVLGPRGRIRRCNRALSAAFPSAAGAHGAQVVEVIPAPALQDAVEELLDRSAPRREQSPPERLQSRLQLEIPAGHFMAVHLSRPLAPTPEMGAVAVFHDITDLIRLERIRRDFVANVSHELRTPLTAIQGYAETLASLDTLPDDCRRFGEIIRKHGAYLARMVEELLALARLESEEGSLTLLPCDPRDALNTAAAFCADALSGRRLHLAAALPDHLRVMASPTHLGQVFRNLLENACRYAPEDSEIRVDAHVQGAEVLCRVRDQGPGIPAADLDRIFERFYRVEKHRGTSSTGLGLAICKHIIERHGGRIWAESPASDAATALCFTLPLAMTESSEKPQ